MYVVCGTNYEVLYKRFNSSSVTRGWTVELQKKSVRYHLHEPLYVVILCSYSPALPGRSDPPPMSPLSRQSCYGTSSHRLAWTCRTCRNSRRIPSQSCWREWRATVATPGWLDRNHLRGRFEGVNSLNGYYITASFLRPIAQFPQSRAIRNRVFNTMIHSTCDAIRGVCLSFWAIHNYDALVTLVNFVHHDSLKCYVNSILFGQWWRCLPITKMCVSLFSKQTMGQSDLNSFLYFVLHLQRHSLTCFRSRTDDHVILVV